MFISASGFVVSDGNVPLQHRFKWWFIFNLLFLEQKLKVGGTPDEPNVIISASQQVDAPKFRIDEVGFIIASGGFLGKWFINDDGLSSLKTENGSTAQDNVDFFLSGSASTSFSNGDRRRMIMSSSFFNVTTRWNDNGIKYRFKWRINFYICIRRPSIKSGWYTRCSQCNH